LTCPIIHLPSFAMLDLSIVIPTLNRADSLRITLDCLLRTEKSGIQFEIVIADNSVKEATGKVVEEFQKSLPVRYLAEPRRDGYGKAHALNRAIDSGLCGEITVVIDDDISPKDGWLLGVIAVCRRWPKASFFGGKIDVIWPDEGIPDWAKDYRIHPWLFSNFSLGESDRTLPEGRWFAGGHFWFRTSLVTGGRRFRKCWLTEPEFMLNLMQEGHEGVYAPDAVVSHRIQKHLLNPEVALKRAKQVGREFVNVRLRPYRSRIRQSRLCKDHPIAARLFAVFTLAKWSTIRAVTHRIQRDRGFSTTLIAQERIAFAKELLRILGQEREYRLV